MTWSLESADAALHRRSPDENADFRHDIVALNDAAAALRLTTQQLTQHVRVEIHEPDVTPDVDAELRAQGFLRTATHARMLMDLARFEGPESFAASLGRKHRHHLRQTEEKFRLQGGKSTVVPLDELGPKYLEELFLKMVLPACSSLGANPYERVATRNGFVQFLTVMAGQGELFALVLETSRGVVAVAFLAITQAISEPERGGPHVTRAWVRPVSDDETVLDFLIAHADPLQESECDFSSLLYLRSIEFALDRECTLWSGGYERGTCAGGYLGVRAVKRHWGAAPFMVFRSPHRYLRLSHRKCLLDGLDVETSHLEGASGAQVFVPIHRSERNRLLLGSAAKSMPVRVVTLSETDAGYWRQTLEKYAQAMAVTVESFPTI